MKSEPKRRSTQTRTAAPVGSFFRALLEQTQELVSVLDGEGCFRYASPSHRRVLGYEPEGLIGRNTFDLVHQEDRSALFARFREALAQAGPTSSEEYRYRHADGSWRVLTATGTNLLEDSAVRGLVVNARDVSEYTRTAGILAEHRRMLAERLAELDLLYQSAPVGLALVDCDLRFVRVNDTLAAINGRPAHAHVGRRLQDVVADLAPALEPLYRRVIETGVPIVDMEVRGTTPAEPNVERDWLVNYYRLDDPAGRPLGVNAVVLDITARKQVERTLERGREDLEVRVRQRTAELEHANTALRAEITERLRAEESLRRSEARHRYLVENISDVIFTVDAEGRITYISPTVERVSGHTSADLLGRICFDLIDVEDREALRRSFRRSLGGLSEPMEYRVRGRDGQVRWVRSHAAVVLEGGRAVALHGVLSDVTERRTAEIEARRRQAELAHTQRLTTAGEMTAEIAHQINQPLAAISNFANGLASQLRRGRGDREAMEGVARRIAGEALRAGEVIRQLRTFLRKGEGLVRLCDLNDLVANVYRLIEEDFRREAIEVRLHLAPDLPSMELNVVLIEQVVLNLLRNALEAMAAAGPGAHRLEVTTHADPEAIGLAVRDTGVGLPDGAEPQVFEAFFTTKPEGLGLGLSVSRSIIEANDGRLWIERNEGGGTTAGFTLPRRTPGA